jgi:hypothetical protein
MHRLSPGGGGVVNAETIAHEVNVVTFGLLTAA